MTEPVAETPSCRIMTLPDELLIASSLLATKIEPRNAPAHFIASSFEPQQIAVLTTKFWGSKPRVLSVQFLDNPTATFRRMFLEAANSWDCGITFAETAGHGDVRLSRAGSGYWSYLGPDILVVPPGQPTMNLQAFTERTPQSEWLRVPPHEIGHTLGMPHEHLRRTIIERLNREAVYAWFGRMGWTKQMTDANVFTPVEEYSLMMPPSPDETSIMTYQFNADLTIDYTPIVGGARINADDLAYVDLIYPKKNVPPPPVTPPPPVEPPKPEPPPVKPPKPTKPPEPAAGPFDLVIGRTSGTRTMVAGGPILFRFRTNRYRLYVAQTGGKLALTMELLDADRKRLDVDVFHRGKNGNAAIARALEPGTYFLRVRGIDPSVAGPFRIKVGAVA